MTAEAALNVSGRRNTKRGSRAAKATRWTLSRGLNCHIQCVAIVRSERLRQGSQHIGVEPFATGVLSSTVVRFAWPTAWTVRGIRQHAIAANASQNALVPNSGVTRWVSPKSGRDPITCRPWRSVDRNKPLTSLCPEAPTESDPGVLAEFAHPTALRQSCRGSRFQRRVAIGSRTFKAGCQRASRKSVCGTAGAVRPVSLALVPIPRVEDIPRAQSFRIAGRRTPFHSHRVGQSLAADCHRNCARHDSSQ